MRGLKLNRKSNRTWRQESHLLQMRGLKLLELVDAKSAPLVASFTDAWIETYVGSLGSQAGLGRIFYRCVDWNVNNSGINGSNCSRIFYRCVDWNLGSYPTIISLFVASFTDAWIETISEGVIDKPETSHLLQMRGLKPFYSKCRTCPFKSHLLQMRGLKQTD